jgi:class 3 adenylate cyclase
MSDVRERTLVMTDIEGSTALWEREPLMGAAVARHEVLVGAAVADAGGLLVKHKGEGDSTFSVFDEAGAAVAAAVALQRAMAAERWSTSNPLRVRIGIDTGAVEERDGDYYGRAANRAARVRGLGAGGTIVLTDATVRRLGRALPEGATLVDLGQHVLRGVDGLVGLASVAHAELTDPAPALAHLRFRAAPTVPAGLRFDAHEPLVGRRRELDALTTAWSDAIGGQPAVALVAGEPGAGKTRLLAALAERAAADGALILHGRCDEERLRPYQPFAEAVADAATRLSSDELLALVGPALADLTVVVPELRRRIPIDEAASSERFVVFEAVAELVGSLASDRPVLLVAEDLHWADPPTLALLRHLARRVVDRPVLLAASYRDTDADATEGLVRALVDIRRTTSTVDLRIEGLGRDEVGQLLGPGHADHLDEVWATTDGNPFLVVELRTSLDDDRAGVPTTVRQSVGQRVDSLPEDGRRLVRAAAVAGEDIDLATISRAAGVEPGAAQPAVVRGLIGEMPGPPGRLRIVHALVRDAVLDRLSSIERRDLHGRIAGAIEELHRSDLEPYAARLAHHHCQAGDVTAGGPAYTWSVRAGHAAGASLAYEKAERQFRAAAAIAEQAGDATGHIVAELDRAEVLARRGRPTEGRQVATAAEAAAVSVGDAELRAWAVFTTRFGQAVGEPENLATVRSALDALPPDSRWRIPLEVHLAGELMQAGRVDDGIALLDDANADAEAGGDAVLLGLALTGRHLYVDRLETPVEQILDVLATTSEATVPSLRLAPAVLRVQTESLRIGEQVARGEVDAARRAADGFAARYGEESGVVEANVPLFRISDAMLSGDWSTWRGLVAERRADDEWSSAYAPQLMGCDLIATWLRSGLGDLTTIIESLPPSLMLVQGARALALAEGGRSGEARTVIEACAASGGLEARAHTVVGRSELALLSYAVAEIDDADHAARLLPLLEPRRGRIAAWAGWAFWGSFDHLAGVLAATCGRDDQAIAHLRDALALHERSGWQALSTATRVELAVVLDRRRAPGDLDEAGQLTARARSDEAALELGPMQQRLAALDRR